MATRLLVLLLFIASEFAQADVELKAEERANLGIQTEVAKPVQAGRQWSATALVLDATPLITAVGEWQSAESAAAASQAESERSERLYHDDTNIARKTLDAARVQSVADAARVSAARAQVLGTWGHALSALPSRARSELVADLLAGRASLARVDLIEALPTSLREPRVEVRALNGQNPVSARWLGRLPQASNTTLAGAALLRVPAPLAAGSFLDVAMTEPTPSLEGLSVPASAVIRWRGQEWAYQEVSPNRFVRCEVHSGSRIGGRALLARQSGNNLKVVTVGARTLLAAELGAAAAPGDAGEEN